MIHRTIGEVQLVSASGARWDLVVCGHTVGQLTHPEARHIFQRCRRLKLEDVGEMLESVLERPEIRAVPAFSSIPEGTLIDMLRAARRAWSEWREGKKNENPQ